jgi:hypothetical protein
MLWPDTNGGMLNGDAGSPWWGYDQLWVQESYQILGHGSVGPALTVKYMADGAVRTVEVSAATYEKFRARKTTNALGGRFMYRDISRITLKSPDAEAERLNKISEPDALAEGIDNTYPFLWQSDEWQNQRPNAARYAGLWQSINGPGSWDKNPWVWKITFTPEQKS